MRLGQLSRQLNISSDQIVKVLHENFREVNNHPNIKITDEELEFLNDRFAPEPEPVAVEEVAPVHVEPAPQAETEVEVEAEEITIDTPAENEAPPAQEFVASLRPQVISLEDEFLAQTESLETYKAEKPHLEGLKVIGKIDLPEPVVKEKEENSEEKPARKLRNDRASRQKSERNERRSNSLIEERKKAQRLAIKKKYEEEERLKELKKKHYEEQVKAKIKPPVAKKKKRKVEETISAPAVPYANKAKVAPKQPQKAPKAKNPLKRFWLWLNGAYDN